MKADNLTENCFLDNSDESKEDDDSDDSLDDTEDFGDLCFCRMNRDEESMVKCGNKFHKMGQWFHL